MNDIAIYGAGGFGREVLTLINAINDRKETYNFIGFFDDSLKTVIKGYPVLGNRNDLKGYKKPLGIVFAVGNPLVKKEIIREVSANDHLSYPTLIHPNVVIGECSTVSIGEGTIITAGNIITCDIRIGKHVILNLACTVGHDTVIGDYASFMPTVNISGEVNIGEAAFIGTGAKIINLKKIGEGSVIGAGAVVASDIPDHVTAVGVPAKVLKRK